MDNIFSTLKGTLPKPAESDLIKLKQLEADKNQASPVKLKTTDLVKAWQKNSTPEMTSELLKRMQPTINSAISSYAPGMEPQLSVKAAKLTLDALKKYSPDFGTEPSTFVFHNLKRLNRLAAASSNIIPIPEGQAAERRRLQDIAARFEDKKGREPSLQELADESGFSTKKVDKLLNDSFAVVPESATLSEDSQRSTLGHNALDDNDYFEYVYASVGPVDQKIMEWSSGLRGKPVLSNNDIAARLKISPAAVSQRRNKIQQLLSDVRSLV